MAKTLVIYYSRTGNTRFIGEQIAKITQGDVEELLDKKNRKGLWGYLISGRDAVLNKAADLFDLKKNPAEYDLIFVGTPNWAYNITPAIRAYLQKYNLEGKHVALFTTQESMGAEKVFNTLRRLIPKAEIVSEKYFNKVLLNQDRIKGEIALWLNSLLK